ncbi:hypothetical protein B0H13DRAFT_1909245 [Mycena leptocephala]|nr:hypothetical protein B0H13DRAFT_1909245 [Mycena leptocephala]
MDISQLLCTTATETLLSPELADAQIRILDVQESKSLQQLRRVHEARKRRKESIDDGKPSTRKRETAANKSLRPRTRVKKPIVYSSFSSPVADEPLGLTSQQTETQQTGANFPMVRYRCGWRGRPSRYRTTLDVRWPLHHVQKRWSQSEDVQNVLVGTADNAV